MAVRVPSVASPPRASGSRAASLRRSGRARSLALVRRLPLACWACMAVAIVNAVAWASITPAFQVPDETVHMGYVQWVGESGSIPRTLTPYYDPSADADAAFNHIPWSLTGHPSWSAENEAELRRLMAQDLPRRAEKGAAYASNNPPLYYLLAAVPYRIAHGAEFLDRMYVVRLFSALLAALTVALTFAFLRELLPRTPWAWTVGALAVALQPVFGFVAGGVNPDNLLWAESACLFWLLARAFRRGLTLRRGIAIGLVLFAGMVTKGSMFGLVPGALLGLALLAWRAGRGRRRRAFAAAGAGALAAGLPMLAWLQASHLLLDRSTESTSAGLGSLAGGAQPSIGGQLSYLWQFYLPKLSFMTDWFERFPEYPIWHSYFQGFVGRFGWYAFGFPKWVNVAALFVAGAVLLLAGAELWRSRRALRTRWAEMLTYVTLAGGLMLLVNVAGYRYRVLTEQNFEQIRYLFPLLALYGALIALAARGAGRRWGPVAGVALITIAAGQLVFAQLISLAHYYS